MLAGHSDDATAVAWSPTDPSTALAVGDDGTIRAWDLAPMQQRHARAVHRAEDALRSAVAPSQLLASALSPPLAGGRAVAPPAGTPPLSGGDRGVAYAASPPTTGAPERLGISTGHSATPGGGGGDGGGDNSPVRPSTAPADTLAPPPSARTAAAPLSCPVLAGHAGRALSTDGIGGQLSAGEDGDEEGAEDLAVARPRQTPSWGISASTARTARAEEEEEEETAALPRQPEPPAAPAARAAPLRPSERLRGRRSLRAAFEAADSGEADSSRPGTPASAPRPRRTLRDWLNREP